MRKPNYSLIRRLIEHNVDYTIDQAVFLIEEYILSRTGKIVYLMVNEYTNIVRFEYAITIADAYFKGTYGKTWY